LIFWEVVFKGGNPGLTISVYLYPI
jgi:hypothetical protein